LISIDIKVKYDPRTPHFSFAWAYFALHS